MGAKETTRTDEFAAGQRYWTKVLEAGEAIPKKTEKQKGTDMP